MSYDYSQAGFYFITICTQNRLHLLGEILADEMMLNNAGIMVRQIWDEILDYYNKFAVHECVVMPNHIHGIIEMIPDPVGGNPPVVAQKTNNAQITGNPPWLPKERPIIQCGDDNNGDDNDCGGNNRGQAQGPAPKCLSRYSYLG